MNRPELQQLMEEKFDSLPSVIKELINSPEIGERIDSITQKSELDEDQADMLADEIGYVLFRITSLASFKKILQENLELVPSKALAISTEVYGSIFQQVKKFLKDVDDEIRPDPVATMSETAKRLDIRAKETEARKNENVSIDLDDTESLNHHDILSEIENPSSSVLNNLSSKSIPGRMPEAEDIEYGTDLEESHLELEGYVAPESEVMMPSARASASTTTPANRPETPSYSKMASSQAYSAQGMSNLSMNSIHHDIVPNLNGFKPLDLQSNVAHINTPMTDPMNKAAGMAEALGSKLDSPVSNQTTEVYMPQKQSARKIDPYREPME